MAGPYDAQTALTLDFEEMSQQGATSPAPLTQAASVGEPAAEDATQRTNDTTPSVSKEVRASTPSRSTSVATSVRAGYTPMRSGKVHALDDSPSHRHDESLRRERAQAAMSEKGRAVEAMRSGKLKQAPPRKNIAGGDAVRDSGIPVWGRRPLTTYSKDRATPSKDPFDRAQELSAMMRAAENNRLGLPKPLTLGPRMSAVARGKQRALPRSASPPPVPGPSAQRAPHMPTSARSELEGSGSDADGDFPRLPTRAQRNTSTAPTPAAHGAREARPTAADEDELEAMHEAAARRIQDELWAEERAYNHSHRTQSLSGAADPMDEDEFDDEDDEADILAMDSDREHTDAAGYDSFEDISEADSPDEKEEPAPLLNIEPALGDDRAKAAARASIFADTKARIRWSPPTHEPIAGMTQAKLVAGIDPVQLQQHVKAAASIDNIYIGIVHAVGGTRSSEIDRVTLVTALDTMIGLTCRTGTSVLFSAARQDQNGPRLRPGTVLIDTADEELGALWQESAHWAQAGVRITIQKYRQAHSAFMVTLEGTRRNRQSVAHGVRCAAKKLPALKAVFRQYNTLYPGKGRAARDNLIKSIVARPLTLTSRKALGFGTVQFNIFARLHERDPDADPSSLTGSDEMDGYPALTAEMHWAVRDAFQQVTIIDGRLGDATPVQVPWDCAFCFAESHPVGKCELKDVEDWFKPYEDFLAANAPPVDRGTHVKAPNKGKGKAAPLRGGRGGGGGKSSAGGRANAGGRGGPPRAGPSRFTLSHKVGGA